MIDNAERMRQIGEYKAAISRATFHNDGYRNMLNKVGMLQDNSTAWQYNADGLEADGRLAALYAENGLFGKIIDRPAEDAVAKGIDLSDFGDELSQKIERRLARKGYVDAMTNGIKWSRLFGGAIGVMIVNDGRGLEEPLDWKHFESLEEIRVFERAIVQPDFTTLNTYYFNDYSPDENRPWGQPLWYAVYSMYGQFKVHWSRCLIFRNGYMPEYISHGIYQYWGIPVYNKIRDSLREVVTAHHDGTKLLERSVLGVYKMKNLSNLLATDEGEDKVIQRLQVIDMARNIINSMAIDNDGEDYQYINATMSGVSDIIDRTCNMLSAVTDIPQTILFGKSPSGMDATGDNDMENYYQLLSRIQSQQMKDNTEILLRMVLAEMVRDGEVKKDEIPEYTVKFNAFKQQTEEEKLNIEKTKVDISQAKAQVAQIYVDMQALDPNEVRRALRESEEFEIQDIITEDDPEELEIPEDSMDMGQEGQAAMHAAGAPVDKPVEQAIENEGEGRTGLGDSAGSLFGDLTHITHEYPLYEMLDDNASRTGAALNTDGRVADFSKCDKMELGLITDGGPGSGNWGHAGRPGQRGGSASSGGSIVAESVSGYGVDTGAQRRKKHIHKCTDGKKFLNRLKKSKKTVDPRKAWRVDDYSHTPEEYKECTMLISDGGSTVAVKPNGNIISVCKCEGDECSGSDMVQAAVEAGGDRLDAFGKQLYQFYTKNGFEAVSWTPFNEEYAPPGWKKGVDAAESILFYKHTGNKTNVTYEEFIKTVKPCVDGPDVYGYDLAEAARDKEMS